MTEAVSAKSGQHVPRQRKTIGKVVSIGGDKTARVIVQRLTKHPKYGKYVHRDTTLVVHDPRNAANVGDKVEITPCRPMSKAKSWRLVQVVGADRSAEPMVGGEQQRNDP